MCYGSGCRYENAYGECWRPCNRPCPDDTEDVEAWEDERARLCDEAREEVKDA